MDDSKHGKHEVIVGDARELPFPDDSFHASVCDPPYGLAFMGRSWDDFEPREYQEWCQTWAKEVKRVLRPGGHLLAFSGNRTHHRAFTGIEDAGFEVRDTLTYLYGEGFPKSMDVSKAIEKAAGRSRKKLAEALRRERESIALSREELAEKVGCTSSSIRDWEEGRARSEGEPVEWVIPSREYHERLSEILSGYPSPKDFYTEDSGPDRRGDGTVYGLGHSGEEKVYEDSSPLAERWDGFGTQLKPATEFIVLARKPLSEGTIAENVLEWGTGALNIDGTRIQTDESLGQENGGGFGGSDYDYGDNAEWDGRSPDRDGRHPANLLLDLVAARRLDEQSGVTNSGSGSVSRGGEATADKRYTDDGGTNFAPTPGRRRTDSGGASRFFYTSKAKRSERTVDGKIENDHPTVKPVDLMEWLVTLVTAPGQTVLDPFLGSGTTLVACENTRRKCIGVEKQQQWASLARDRIAAERNRLETGSIHTW